ncbi:restriction endonuclease [Flavobacterium sp. D11R37]|uniref:restriction endonuclease n=1 Tax=Flavobacterium TaxID=237 RepID=UPI001CA652C4|nr:MULTISPECIES: restriction endonuclease [Flavobacterium]MBY8963184.1 restriction endonuclease [Flavobacterium coralii]MCR5863482.1 restriction endonuclease [Flavobacterium sp. J372]
MKINAENINIIKASGEKAPFNKGKLKQSLLRSGATNEQADEITNEVIEMLVEGMSTRKIYKTAFRLLRNYSRPAAARYKLKQAIMELGPSGFPFEQFVGELLKHRGYKTQVGVIVKGHCVNHEIDVIAEKDEHHFMIECKFHNRQGYSSDVKIPLYIQSRFLDVERQWKQLDGHSEKFHQGWVVTNTRFSEDAAQYGRCMNMNLVSWDYPKHNGLKDWIDGSGLHPVTCLTTLTQKEKQQLLDRKIVLCKTMHHNQSVLQNIGIHSPRLEKVMEECSALCEEFSAKKFQSIKQ